MAQGGRVRRGLGGLDCGGMAAPPAAPIFGCPAERLHRMARRMPARMGTADNRHCGMARGPVNEHGTVVRFSLARSARRLAAAAVARGTVTPRGL
jgi:hypothetical protein